MFVAFCLIDTSLNVETYKIKNNNTLGYLWIGRSSFNRTNIVASHITLLLLCFGIPTKPRTIAQYTIALSYQKKIPKITKIQHGTASSAIKMRKSKCMFWKTQTTITSNIFFVLVYFIHFIYVYITDILDFSRSQPSVGPFFAWAAANRRPTRMGVDGIWYCVYLMFTHICTRNTLTF